MNWIFTFGLGHPHYGSVVKVIADDFDSARKLMVIEFGYDWGFQYTEEDYLRSREELGRQPEPVLMTLSAPFAGRGENQDGR